MHDLQTLVRLNSGQAEPELPGHRLRLHPRIVALRRQVAQLPVAQDYRRWLIRSLNRYADQIVARDIDAGLAGWDDLEALQQVTLGDRMEACLRQRPRRA